MELKKKKNKEKEKKKIKKMLPPKKNHPPNKTTVPLTMLQMHAKRLNLDKCQAVLLPSTRFTETSVLKSQPHGTAGKYLKPQVITSRKMAGVAETGITR